MKYNLTAFLSGIIFALGLGISGMTLPSKVIGFLNITGDWDPSLAFVMMGAIAVHAGAWHFWLKKKSGSYLSGTFSLSQLKKIDRRLLVGSALFGIGWGVSGFCPGPALLSMASFGPSVLVFVPAMLGGMVLFRLLSGKKRSTQDQSKTLLAKEGAYEAGPGVL